LTPEHRKRWELEVRKHRGPFKKPADLLRRAAASEDVIDSAVIGGVSLADILAGKIAQSQIPANVIAAFHAQFPNHASSFIQAVNHLAGDPEKLAGLVNGVKGKLFEMDYVHWLNNGHLPVGWTADLAHHANNPTWDVVIHDAHGHISELIQNKAVETLASAREAIAAHPDIHVALTHELFAQAAAQPELMGHVIDGQVTLHELNGQVADAVSGAEGADIPFHFPVFGPLLAIGFAVGQNVKMYRNGNISLDECMHNVRERGLLTVLASAGGWATTLLSGEPLVGLPVSIVIRLGVGQLFHNHRRRELLAGYVQTIRASTACLEVQRGRLLMEAPAS
jgi:hypothetical protein